MEIEQADQKEKDQEVQVDNQGQRNREEEVARARRPFWAEEVLLAVQGYGRASRGGADPSSERS